MTDPLTFFPPWLMFILSMLPVIHYGHRAYHAPSFSDSRFNTAMTVTWFFLALTFFLFEIGGNDVTAFRFNARVSVALLALTSVIESAVTVSVFVSDKIRRRHGTNE